MHSHDFCSEHMLTCIVNTHAHAHSQEELADYEKRNSHRSAVEIVKVVVIRTFTNLFTVVALLGAGAAIYFSALFGLRAPSSSAVIQLEGFLSPVVITTLNIVLPFLFSFLARYERFKTQSGEIKMTLLRWVHVWGTVGSYVYYIDLYSFTQCY